MPQEIMVVWNIILSLVVPIIGFVMKEKFVKLDAIEKLLNRTREEVARDYVTNSEVQRITDHIDQRFNRLEEKIDRLIHGHNNA
jgi:hypothetical protein